VIKTNGELEVGEGGRKRVHRVIKIIPKTKVGERGYRVVGIIPKSEVGERGGGRESTEWSKKEPKVRWERGTEESASTDSSKEYPKVRWVREEGRECKGQMKSSPKERWVREEGRESAGWLPKERRGESPLVGQIVYLKRDGGGRQGDYLLADWNYLRTKGGWGRKGER
jgi:hypothetical protein